MDALKRLLRLCSTDRVAGALFVFACAVTVAILGLPRGGIASPPPPPDGTSVMRANDGVKISGTISQKKVVQGSDGVVYLEVNVDPPTIESSIAKRIPVDMVVVLDRSGSMAAENRLPYAKAAISDLLARLSGEDRFGLVTFETTAQVVTPLGHVNEGFRREEQSRVLGLTPAGSTNLSGGLELAETLLASSTPGRTRKIVLLSDGEANVGVIEPTALAAIARRASGAGKIVSTIGMGLDFNESLMASLADHGMGNYSYLENLAGLDTILTKDLSESRAVFASASGLEIRLPAGARLIDSSGYPREGGSSPDAIRLLTGQLLSGVRKSIFLTIGIPTDKTGAISFGAATFNYTADGKPSSVSIDPTQLALDVVTPAREAEALASVEPTVFKKGWSANRLGRIQQDFGAQMKAGKPEAARALVEGYRRDAETAEKKYGVKVLDEKASVTISDLTATANEVAAAPAGVQMQLGNRAAKAAQSKGISEQRSNK